MEVFPPAGSIHSNRSTTIWWCHGIGGGSRDPVQASETTHERSPDALACPSGGSEEAISLGLQAKSAQERPPRGKAASFSGSRPGLDARRLEGYMAGRTE